MFVVNQGIWIFNFWLIHLKTMDALIRELLQDPEGAKLVFMPVSRVLVEEPLSVGRFRVFPPGYVDFATFRPMANLALTSQLDGSDVASLLGQQLREVATSLTGFSLETLASSPVVTFVAKLDWNICTDATHEADLDTLRVLSATAERAFDVVRMQFCCLDLPDTLPGAIGSWNESGSCLGAMIYTPEDHESYLIAGAAIDCTIVVKGIGLDLSSGFSDPLPMTSDGEVAAIAIHAMSLLSDAMHARNDTSKFVRVMTLLEFLASPDGYKKWEKLRGEIACHCANSKQDYLQLIDRFKELASNLDEFGVQHGFRTLIVHHGKFIEELIPDKKKRRELFRELQTYCTRVLGDMLDNRMLTWSDYANRRSELKKMLGVD